MPGASVQQGRGAAPAAGQAERAEQGTHRAVAGGRLDGAAGSVQDGHAGEGAAVGQGGAQQGRLARARRAVQEDQAGLSGPGGRGVRGQCLEVPGPPDQRRDGVRGAGPVGHLLSLGSYGPDGAVVLVRRPVVLPRRPARAAPEPRATEVTGRLPRSPRAMPTYTSQVRLGEASRPREARNLRNSPVAAVRSSGGAVVVPVSDPRPAGRTPSHRRARRTPDRRATAHHGSHFVKGPAWTPPPGRSSSSASPRADCSTRCWCWPGSWPGAACPTCGSPPTSTGGVTWRASRPRPRCRSPRWAGWCPNCRR